MKKSELIKIIVNMKNGDSISIEVLGKNKDFLLGSMVTKVKWFDTPVIIIGGADDDLHVSENLNYSDEEEGVENLIDKWIGKDYIKSVTFNIINSGKVNLEFCNI